MDAEFSITKEMQDAIVYVRPVMVSDLPEDVREQAQGLEMIYAVHNDKGERLALVQNKTMAFVLARQNNLTPVGVH